MYKNTNLLSLIQAKQTLTINGFEKFIKHCGVELKADEINDLEKLTDSLVKAESKAVDLESFYLGYKIPQIGKEFDLLRFGTNFTVNIELKSVSTEENVHKQLKRNRYYLKFLNVPIFHYTFVTDTKKLYKLGKNQTLKKVSIKELADLLKAQEVEDVYDIDQKFNPSDYLVSPFNSTDKFLNGEYFLTNQQEEVKGKILKLISQSNHANFLSLSGGAGTGKTLLTYDIVKSVLDAEGKVLILHCGQLNKGQMKLNELGWKISSIRNYKRYELSEFDLVLIDEAQRIYKPQLDEISQKISKYNGNCVFSFDKLQTLASHEEAMNSSGTITSLCVANSYNLSEKIRSNKEISNFIKSLFNEKRNFEKPINQNIQIRYFDNPGDAKSFLDALNNNDWEVLRFTPSQYKNEFHSKYYDSSRMNSHEVIGQEFDGVAVVIDKFFKYNSDGKLLYIGSAYYPPTKMLFQNITRAKKRLLIVIVQNESLLERCIAITS